MGVILGPDKVGILSEVGGVISLQASLLTIGGQQYSPGVLTRTIADDVALAAFKTYPVYAVNNGGTIELRLSENGNDIGPAGFFAWKLAGLIYTDISSAVEGVLSDLSPGRLIRKIVFEAGATYNKNPLSDRLDVLVVAGGGGGGGVNGIGADTMGAGGGGGAGSGSRSSLLNSIIASTVSVTIGAGGAGGVAGDNPGTNGGNSSFGSLVTANGGEGGRGAIAEGDSGADRGGLGGVIGTGQLAIPGGPGHNSYAADDDANGAIGGPGGNSPFIGSGGAGAPHVSDNPGADATGFGGGGHGAAVGGVTTNFAGGDGADGVIIVEEYL